MPIRKSCFDPKVKTAFFVPHYLYKLRFIGKGNNNIKGENPKEGKNCLKL